VQILKSRLTLDSLQPEQPQRASSSAQSSGVRNEGMTCVGSVETVCRKSYAKSKLWPVGKAWWINALVAVLACPLGENLKLNDTTRIF